MTATQDIEDMEMMVLSFLKEIPRLEDFGHLCFLKTGLKVKAFRFDELAFRSDIAKQGTALMTVPSLIDHFQAEAVSLCMEAWMSRKTSQEELDNAPPPSEDPDRTEVLIVVSYAPGGLQRTSSIPISRREDNTILLGESVLFDGVSRDRFGPAIYSALDIVQKGGSIFKNRVDLSSLFTGAYLEEVDSLRLMLEVLRQNPEAKSGNPEFIQKIKEYSEKEE